MQNVGNTASQGNNHPPPDCVGSNARQGGGGENCGGCHQCQHDNQDQLGEDYDIHPLPRRFQPCTFLTHT